MNRLKTIICFIVICANYSYAQPKQDCKNLPEQFISYNNATEQVLNAHFNISETVDTKKSTWIKGLSYFSCDGQNGFLIMSAGGKSYIHQNVPIAIWRSLSTAESFGNYYNRNIKHKFALRITK